MRRIANAGGCSMLILVLLLLGCQHKKAVESGRTAVKGTVTLDGKPLSAGGITFVTAVQPHALKRAVARR